MKAKKGIILNYIDCKYDTGDERRLKSIEYSDIKSAKDDGVRMAYNKDTIIETIEENGEVKYMFDYMNGGWKKVKSSYKSEVFKTVDDDMGYRKYDYSDTGNDVGLNTSYNTNENYVFDSGINIISKFKVSIPMYILDVCNAIAKNDMNSEFMIICKGKYTPSGFELEENYVIPEQEVTYSSVSNVNGEEVMALKEDGWNTVIHCHPMDLKSFSSVDDDYINKNFKCSILYCKNEFVKAVLNIPYAPDGNDYGVFATECDIEMLSPIKIDKIKGIEKIKHKKYEYKGYNPYWAGYNW